MKGTMPTRCIVAGCSNTSKDGVSLHFFPRDEKIRKLWTARVKLSRADWSGPTDSSAVCSAHFSAEDFEDPGLYAQFNLKKPARRLKETAVPTIRSHEERSTSKRAGVPIRSAAEKRRKKRVSASVSLAQFNDSGKRTAC